MRQLRFLLSSMCIIILASTTLAEEWVVDRVFQPAHYAVQKDPNDVSTNEGNLLLVAVESGGVDWVELRPGMVIANASWIRTGNSGRIQLSRGEEMIQFKPRTTASIRSWKTDDAKLTYVRQSSGSLFLDIETRETKHTVVETPLLVALVKGTRFEVDYYEDTATLRVEHGTVEAVDTVREESVDVRSLQSVSVSLSKSKKMDVVGPGPKDEVAKFTLPSSGSNGSTSIFLPTSSSLLNDPQFGQDETTIAIDSHEQTVEEEDRSDDHLLPLLKNRTDAPDTSVRDEREGVKASLQAIQRELNNQAERRALRIEERRAERVAERQAERKAERVAERQAERKAERVAERQAERKAERVAERQAERKAERVAERQAERKAERVAERQAARQAARQAERRAERAAAREAEQANESNVPALTEQTTQEAANDLSTADEASGGDTVENLDDDQNSSGVFSAGSTESSSSPEPATENSETVPTTALNETDEPTSGTNESPPASTPEAQEQADTAQSAEDRRAERVAERQAARQAERRAERAAAREAEQANESNSYEPETGAASKANPIEQELADLRNNGIEGLVSTNDMVSMLDEALGIAIEKRVLAQLGASHWSQVFSTGESPQFVSYYTTDARQIDLTLVIAPENEDSTGAAFGSLTELRPTSVYAPLTTVVSPENNFIIFFRYDGDLMMAMQEIEKHNGAVSLKPSAALAPVPIPASALQLICALVAFVALGKFFQRRF